MTDNGKRPRHGRNCNYIFRGGDSGDSRNPCDCGIAKLEKDRERLEYIMANAAELIDLLKDEPQAVLAYREPNRVGHEYLVTGHGQLTPNSQWWFDFTGAVVHTQRNVTPDDLRHTLRVGMVTPGSRMPDILAKVNDRFAGRV